MILKIIFLSWLIYLYIWEGLWISIQAYMYFKHIIFVENNKMTLNWDCTENSWNVVVMLQKITARWTYLDISAHSPIGCLRRKWNLSHWNLMYITVSFLLITNGAQRRINLSCFLLSSFWSDFCFSSTVGYVCLCFSGSGIHSHLKEYYTGGLS